jgi:hypothetical protein
VSAAFVAAAVSAAFDAAAVLSAALLAAQADLLQFTFMSFPQAVHFVASAVLHAPQFAHWLTAAEALLHEPLLVSTFTTTLLPSALFAVAVLLQPAAVGWLVVTFVTYAFFAALFCADAQAAAADAGSKQISNANVTAIILNTFFIKYCLMFVSPFRSVFLRRGSVFLSRPATSIIIHGILHKINAKYLVILLKKIFEILLYPSEYSGALIPYI